MKKNIGFLYIIALLYSTQIGAQIDTNWVSIVSKKYTLNINDLNLDDFSQEVKYHALIIGVQDYQDNSFPDLKEPIADAERLRKILNDFYTFEPSTTLLLKNPTKYELSKALEDLAKKVSSNDNLLIFYAGHGEWDPKSETGYWLPSDAIKSDRSSWFSNSSLRDYIRAISARHVLLITDACFGGSLFRGDETNMRESTIFEELNQLPSRKAMTSGALRLVPDDSIFIDYLIRRLGQNTHRYLPADRLFYSFNKDVLLESPGQTPQFRTIQNAGEDNGGEFIFKRKKQ